MAAWCLSAQQSPEVYKSLSRYEREAFYAVIRRSK